MDATGSGILGFFTLAFVILVAGVIAEQYQIDPIGFYQLSALLGVAGVVLIIQKAGGLGSFGIKW